MKIETSVTDENTRAAGAVRRAVEMLQFISIEKIADADLVPLIKEIQNVAKFATALHVEIERRVLLAGAALPGASTKDSVTQRKWNNEEIAATLALEQFGMKAFKLVGPAAIEKLGPAGKALVAVASYKPPPVKQVVY